MYAGTRTFLCYYSFVSPPWKTGVWYTSAVICNSRTVQIKLRYRPGECRGVVSQVEGHPGVLFRIANFHTLALHRMEEQVPKAPAQRVNWLVLQGLK